MLPTAPHHKLYPYFNASLFAHIHPNGLTETCFLMTRWVYEEPAAYREESLLQDWQSHQKSFHVTSRITRGQATSAASFSGTSLQTYKPEKMWTRHHVEKQNYYCSSFTYVSARASQHLLLCHPDSNAGYAVFHTHSQWGRNKTCSCGWLSVFWG